MRAHVSALVLASFVLTACGPNYDCGAFVYSPSEERCVCPPDFMENEDFTSCIPVDAGTTPDGGMPDAPTCVPRAEECNGEDDDCDGVIDGPTAAVSCGSRERATSVGCTAGECIITECVAGFANCDGDQSTGCEARLDTLTDCGACGNTCGWACDAGACNDAIEISGAADHHCVLLESGRVACWGSNDRGQLGIGVAGAAESRLAPTYVTGPGGSGHLEGVVQIEAGAEHTCARTDTGELWCWGANATRQLGDGTATDRAVPVRAVGVVDARDISVGSTHTCAAIVDGRIYCWGSNESGQLGLGHTSAALGAQRVSGISNASTVAGAGRATCALLMDGGVRCWGRDVHGVLGTDFADSMALPVQPIGVAAAQQIVVGREHACALLTSGALWCWGSNYSGQLGGIYGYGAQPVPFEVEVIARPTRVFAAQTATYFVDATGRAFQMGDPLEELIDAGAPAAAISGGTSGSCVLTTSGAVRCAPSFVDLPAP